MLWSPSYTTYIEDACYKSDNAIQIMMKIILHSKLIFGYKKF